MNNNSITYITQTLNRTINKDTGEIINESVSVDSNKRYYQGPRKYWRIMEDYDKAQLILGSRAGILFMIYLKSEVNPITYRITINKTHVSEDLGISRRSVISIINKLIENNYLIAEDRGQYFVNPSLFYSKDIKHDEWYELKQDFENKTINRNQRV